MLRSPLLRLMLGAALLVLGLAGCGGDSDNGGGPSTAKLNNSPAPKSAFPVTVEHKYGATTVDAPPKRIAIVGLTEQDTVLQLGYVPIATTEWYGKQPSAVWPWAHRRLGQNKPVVLNTSDGFQFEKIASLHPDLIIGTNSGMKKSDYKKLSAIAPTVAPPQGSTDYFSPWDVQTQLIADALGKKQQGQQIIANVKMRYAQAAKQHKKFAGQTVAFAQNAFYDGQLYLYPEGVNTEFLTYLGFQINPRIDALPHKAGEQVSVSTEQLPLADSDVMVFATEKASDVTNLKQVPTFASLDAVKQHRVVYTDPILSGAMYFMTPLSMIYVLDNLTPRLADAVVGKAPTGIVKSAS